MVQIFQIVKGIVRPQDMATDRGRATRSADFPLKPDGRSWRLEGTFSPAESLTIGT